MDVFLGIDTSCYTTSLCLVDDAYEVVADERIILSVAKGGRGLSQSNMVYQHTRNLPVLFERLAGILSRAHIRAIAVTDQPRRRDDSYMPAFLAGLGYARALAAVLGVPLYRLSHQENHLLAVLRSLGHIGTDPFTASTCPVGRRTCCGPSRMHGASTSPASAVPAISAPASSSTAWAWPWPCRFRRASMSISWLRR